MDENLLAPWPSNLEVLGSNPRVLPSGIGKDTQLPLSHIAGVVFINTYSEECTRLTYIRVEILQFVTSETLLAMCEVNKMSSFEIPFLYSHIIYTRLNALYEYQHRCINEYRSINSNIPAMLNKIIKSTYD